MLACSPPRLQRYKARGRLGKSPLVFSQPEYAGDFVIHVLMKDEEKKTEKEMRPQGVVVMMWPATRETINLQFGERAEQLRCVGEWRAIGNSSFANNGRLSDILSVMIGVALVASSFLPSIRACTSSNGRMFAHIHAVMRAPIPMIKLRSREIRLWSVG